MRSVLVGAVESTRVAFDALATVPGWLPEAVVTLPPEAAARHSDYVDLAPAVRAAGTKLIYAININDPATLTELTELKGGRPDFIFVIGWSQICRRPFLALPEGAVIGFHPAPLPRLRGRAAVPWTILLDEKITASSLIWMDEGADSGPILLQRFFHVRPDETARSLLDQHLLRLGSMLVEACGLLERPDPPHMIQDETVATYGTKRVTGDGLITWSDPAPAIARLVRAVGPPYPGAFTFERGARLILTGAEARPRKESIAGLTGQVLETTDRGFLVRCGHGDLWVTGWLRGNGSASEPPRLHQKLG